MSGMAEVLAAHYIDITKTNPDNIDRCVCGYSADPMNISWDGHLAESLSAAGFGPVKEAKAVALEEAADDFEGNIGVGEFEELSRRDDATWVHIDDAWEYQGPYMDWLRNRAAELRKP